MITDISRAANETEIVDSQQVRGLDPEHFPYVSPSNPHIVGTFLPQLCGCRNRVRDGVMHSAHGQASGESEMHQGV